MTDVPDSGTPLDEELLTRSTGAPNVSAVATIGPYRLSQRIGEGGMGEVWLAEQLRPVRRQVALKLVKLGMDTAQVVARFEAERQALAVMEHPAIARVFDAGVTPQGRPYFAMEYVRGEAITAYCSRHRLSTRERIDLFLQVCDGVQHAHQKGIIHRDLKPSNVLVTVQDNRPVPKIIDFGVAKATAQRLSERTLFTELGSLIGTPEYMSPEQAEMTGLDIDTRTDVYALGMILYELLAGVLPFDAKALRAKGLDEIRRMIRDVDLPRPSTHVTAVAASMPAPQPGRGDSVRLAKELRGDLDWITMKALEKDRTRRYGSISDLAADLCRHLDNQPVLASPPSTVYRVGKFVRRHRIGVTAVGTVAVLLVAFAATMAVQARRISRERDRANREAEAAKQVSDFLVGAFHVSDPSETRGNTITAREILDKGAAKIDKDLSTQPEIQTRLMATMGQVYKSLGLYRQAAPLLERSLQIRRRVLGRESPDTLASMNAMGGLLFAQGNMVDAEASFHEAVDGRRRILGPNHPDTLSSISNLGSVLMVDGKYSEAEPYLREALEIRRRTLGIGAPDTIASMNNLGGLLLQQGKLSEAEGYYREALALSRRVQGNDHPVTLTLLTNVARLLEKEEKFDEAEALFREGLNGRRRVLGFEHPDALSDGTALGELLLRKGNLPDAEHELREVLERQRRVLPLRHRDISLTLVTLAMVDNAQKRYHDAETLAREGLEIDRETFGTDYYLTAEAVSVLGESLTGQKKFDEAEPLLVEGYGRLERSSEVGALKKRDALERVVNLYDKWGKSDQAAVWRAKSPNGTPGKR